MIYEYILNLQYGKNGRALNLHLDVCRIYDSIFFLIIFLALRFMSIPMKKVKDGFVTANDEQSSHLLLEEEDEEDEEENLCWNLKLK